jgi:hypothetical protein
MDNQVNNSLFDKKALLYIVPCLLISVLVVAVINGNLIELFKFDEEEEKEEVKKEENKKEK